MIYDILYKTLISPKLLQFRFDKIDGLLRVYDGSKYLVLLGPEKYDVTYNRIRYVMSLKSSTTYIFPTIFRKSKLIFMILHP